MTDLKSFRKTINIDISMEEYKEYLKAKEKFDLSHHDIWVVGIQEVLKPEKYDNPL